MKVFHILITGLVKGEKFLILGSLFVFDVFKNYP